MSPKIVGHRGVAGTFPENTRISVQAAIDMGLPWVEVDVQPTKDNILIVCHDHTINRCSNGKGRIDDFTLEELSQFDFGSWFSSEFSGEKIMTLEELLSLAQQHQLGLNIEVKVDKHDVTTVVSQLKQQLDNHPIDKDNILLSSFSHEIIRELHQHCAGYKLGILSERLSNKDKLLLDEVDAFSCNLNYKWVTEKHIDYLHTHNYEIWCYTVNEPQKFNHLDKVDAIFSDWPDRFM